MLSLVGVVTAVTSATTGAYPSVELELVDDSSLSAQETTARHKHEIRIRKMKITFFIVYSIKNYKERVLKSNRFRLFNQ